MALIRWRGARAARKALKTQRRSYASPFPQSTPQEMFVTARHWGIAKAQIQELYDLCQNSDGSWSDEVNGSCLWSDGDSVRAFVQKFIKPITRGTKMGYALWRNMNQPLEVSVMISHSWDGNAKSFFEDVLQALADDEVAYICFLSNYQGSAEEVRGQLGADAGGLPFTEVVSAHSCKRLLVVPNEALKEQNGLFSRMWCSWEIYVGVMVGLPVYLTHRDDEAYFWGSLSPISTRYSRCGDPNLPINEDERMIRQSIEWMPIASDKQTSIQIAIFFLVFGVGTIIAALAIFESTTVGVFFGSAVAIIAGNLLQMTSGVLYECWKRFRQTDDYATIDDMMDNVAKNSYTFSRMNIFDLLDLINMTTTPPAIANLITDAVLKSRGDLAADAMPWDWPTDLLDFHVGWWYLLALTGFMSYGLIRPNKVGCIHGVHFRSETSITLARIWIFLVCFVPMWTVFALHLDERWCVHWSVGVGSFGMALAMSGISFAGGKYRRCVQLAVASGYVMTMTYLLENSHLVQIPAVIFVLAGYFPMTAPGWKPEWLNKTVQVIGVLVALLPSIILVSLHHPLPAQ